MSNDLNDNHHSYHYENEHGNGDDIVNLSSGFTNNSMDIVCHSVKKSKVSQNVFNIYLKFSSFQTKPIIQHQTEFITGTQQPTPFSTGFSLKRNRKRKFNSFFYVF